jgi:hypothetical protein
MGIIETSQRQDYVLVLRHYLFWVVGLCIALEPIRGTSRGLAHP